MNKLYALFSFVCLMLLGPMANSCGTDCSSRMFVAGDEVSDSLLISCGVDSFFTEETIDDDLFVRMNGKSFKSDCTTELSELRYLRILHKDASGKSIVGELVCNKKISGKLLEIFEKLYHASYPIESVRLIDEFDADDELSMRADNSSSFNFRNVSGTKRLSLHSYGLAVDINPLYNPYYKKYGDGRVLIQPEGSSQYLDRTRPFKYKIADGDLCVTLFKMAGFEWGGDWTTCKDYQHFEYVGL